MTCSLVTRARIVLTVEMADQGPMYKLCSIKSHDRELSRSHPHSRTMALIESIPSHAEKLLSYASNLPISLKLLVSVLGPLGIYIFTTLLARLNRTLRSPLRNLPSPPLSNSLSLKTIFFGHLSQLRNYNYATTTDRWVHEYGHVIRYRGILGENKLLTVDLKAIAHVIQKSMDYQKPIELNYNLRKLVGPGVLVTEGELQCPPCNCNV